MPRERPPVSAGLPGRPLPPLAAYVYERLPQPPATFSSADVVALCEGVHEDFGADDVCDPADIVGLLSDHDLVTWRYDGFVKRAA